VVFISIKNDRFSVRQTPNHEEIKWHRDAFSGTGVK
jgi:hypothetical protein